MESLSLRNTWMEDIDWGVIAFAWDGAHRPQLAEDITRALEGYK